MSISTGAVTVHGTLLTTKYPIHGY